MKELLYLKDDQLKDLIEKLSISYRETFTDSKEILDKLFKCISYKYILTNLGFVPLKGDILEKSRAAVSKIGR